MLTAEFANGAILVKLVSPEVRTALGIDELGMHAQPSPLGCTLPSST
ncbi:hypothetical protein QA640_14790 [Bradyrhizobium sp. CB82]|nr:hypothetical protein [Bradyrhizobium sp. CB82]WFU43590.1 hypothetical protein QA640_14790 [Bradyrhizobium sp. CB82]